jgi:hypothetical protein
MRNGAAIDIKGIRTIDDVIADIHPANDACQISLEELKNAYFISEDDDDEHEIVTDRIRSYLKENSGKFDAH